MLLFASQELSQAKIVGSQLHNMVLQPQLTQILRRPLVPLSPKRQPQVSCLLFLVLPLRHLIQDIEEELLVDTFAQLAQDFPRASVACRFPSLEFGAQHLQAAGSVGKFYN